jgi:hypothetical protein
VNDFAAGGADNVTNEENSQSRLSLSAGAWEPNIHAMKNRAGDYPMKWPNGEKIMRGSEDGGVHFAVRARP